MFVVHTESSLTIVSIFFTAGSGSVWITISSVGQIENARVYFFFSFFFFFTLKYVALSHTLIYSVKQNANRSNFLIALSLYQSGKCFLPAFLLIE